MCLLICKKSFKGKKKITFIVLQINWQPQGHLQIAKLLMSIHPYSGSDILSLTVFTRNNEERCDTTVSLPPAVTAKSNTKESAPVLPLHKSFSSTILPILLHEQRHFLDAEA